MLKTANKDLKVGDVVRTRLEHTNGINAVVTHVGDEPCPLHTGNTFVTVHDFDASTGDSTGCESDWCALSDDTDFYVVGTRPDLAAKWLDANQED